MLTTIIVVLIVLWLLGAFGSSISPKFPENGQYGPCAACHSADPYRIESAWDNLVLFRQTFITY